MKTRTADTCELIIWGVPKSLKQRFKARCAQNGETMRGAIVDLLGGYVRQKKGQSHARPAQTRTGEKHPNG